MWYILDNAWFEVHQPRHLQHRLNDASVLEAAPSTNYMTLGPKFFSCNKMAITRRTKHLIKRRALILEALVETHLSSYSKRDLKQYPNF